MKFVKTAVACLNQTPLAWDENFANIVQALAQARAAQCQVVCLPEMALTGYGCEDAFFSSGVHRMAFAQLERLARHTHGMVVAVGLPVYHQKALYNAAALLVDGKIAGFVAKQFLAGDGIHYEPRWFKEWPRGERDHFDWARDDGSSVRYPIGDLVFDVGGVRFGFEICEDAWVANRPGTELALRSVDVICNPSASHFAFGKFAVRERFVVEGSRAYGVAYLYANLLGNEAGRVVYDGGGLIASGGELLGRGERLRFAPVDLVTATVDIDANRRDQARRGSHRPRHDGEPLVVEVPFAWPKLAPEVAAPLPTGWEASADVKHEEFARVVALGLWDYMRKSRSHGFVVSLSGGADSAACAVLVALALRFALAELGIGGVAAQLGYFARMQTAIAASGDLPDLVRAMLACAYQATENSGQVTRTAATAVAQALGAEWAVYDVDALWKGYVQTVQASLGRTLSWEKDDVSLQNVQARVRAPSIWLLANVRGAVLLTTSNRSECAVGYATMDGDTAGGLAPVSGIDKPYLRQWLRWMETTGPQGLGSLPALSYINAQQPTAELRPQAQMQTDEADLMPYDFLEAVEDAAIRDKLTPVEVLQALQPRYLQYQPAQLALWIERFFTLWCRNQWKRERYAPGFHLDDRNLDPRSWCRFPILSGGFASELAQLRGYVAGLHESAT